MLTSELLHILLTYDPNTGVFRWNSRTPDMFTDTEGRSALHTCNLWNSQLAGCVAGSPDSEGYTIIGVLGRNYRAGRLAWLYMTGEWPNGLVDHRSTIRSDDKWENLREATHSQNKANTTVRADSLTGFKGVQQRGNRWIARIQRDGKRVFLGSFQFKELACARYAAAAVEAYGEFARV